MVNSETEPKNNLVLENEQGHTEDKGLLNEPVKENEETSIETKVKTEKVLSDVTKLEDDSTKLAPEVSGSPLDDVIVPPSLPTINIFSSPSEQGESSHHSVNDKEDTAGLIEASAPFPSIEIDAAAKPQENPDITTCIEPSAPPPMLEIDAQNQDALILDNKEKLLRPRSQVISRPKSVALIETPFTENVSSEKPLELEPFTEEQLNHFYYNQELHQVDFFVTEFLKVRAFDTPSIFVFSVNYYTVYTCYDSRGRYTLLFKLSTQ